MTPARRHQIDAREAKPRPEPSSSAAPGLDILIAGLADLDADQLRLQWRNHLGGTPPAHLPRWLLARVLAQRMQVATLGDLDRATLRIVRQARGGDGDGADIRLFAPRDPATRDGVGLKAGALLVREWNGALQRVMVLEKGFAWNGKSYASLSQIAKAITGTSWNGHRFFGLRPAHASIGADRVPAKTGRRSGSDTLRVATVAEAGVFKKSVLQMSQGASTTDAATIASAPSPPIGLGGKVRRPTQAAP